MALTAARFYRARLTALRLRCGQAHSLGWSQQPERRRDVGTAMIGMCRGVAVEISGRLVSAL